MLLRDNNVSIAPQSHASCSVISLFFVKKSDFEAKQSVVCSLFAY